ncbi:MAG TPA: AsmA family protein [Desulfobacteraceae bacterium]|nr:AsmA family protein [Desulfobacteraceae bacterium]
MSRFLKIILLAVGGFVALNVLIAAALYLLVDTNAYRSRFEETASEISNMEVSVDGRLRVGFFPGVNATLGGVRIRDRDVVVASAKEARFEIALLPLLRKEVRIRSIALKHSMISVERDREGNFNFGKPDAAGTASPALNVEKVSLSDATFFYSDKQSGQEYEAANCDLFLRGKAPYSRKNLSFAGALACGEIRIDEFAASNLKVDAEGKNGIIDFKPVTMRIFGAQGSGSIKADFSGAEPLYHLRYSLPQFRIGEFIKRLSPQQVVEGTMDFSTDLSMRGKTVNEIKRSMKGQGTLQGDNLTLVGRDLDEELNRYESSQNFNLVDVGAFFFAGPVGMALTRGYNFASLFQGVGGSTEIRELVSDWKVERGMAQAQDAAMATDENRIALQGRLDFVNERFDDLVVAVIDARGCAKVTQTMHGAFREPVVENPSILKTLTGPVSEVFMKAKDLVTDGECEVFYDGSVSAPQ